MCGVLDNFQSIFSYTIPFDSHGAKKREGSEGIGGGMCLPESSQTKCQDT